MNDSQPPRETHAAHEAPASSAAGHAPLRLYRCHAVLPVSGRDASHVVRTYVTIAPDWRSARARIRDEEPGAEFITLPTESPDAVMTQVWSINAHELAGLRLACEWNESQRRDDA